MSAQTRQPPPSPHAARTGEVVTTGRLAQLLGAELVGPPDLALDAPHSLETAGPRHVTFIRSLEFARRWGDSRAGAAVVSRGVDVPGHDASARALLIVQSADLAWIQVLEAFAPPAPPVPPGVHPTAVVDPGAQVAATASIGPQCTIGPGSTVGEGAVLGAGVRIGRDVRIGARTILHPNVIIQDRCTVGDHCIFHPGVVIGADGFGYIPRPDGRGLMKVPHIGHVEIGSHVEIGANSCIDRGKTDATTIGDGTKIDNLVQVGHNCRIGRSCIICGLCGLAGSVTIGDGAMLGGQVGVADNSVIGAGARLGAMSGVKGEIPPGESWLGAPARPAPEQLRNWAASLHLAEHARTLRRLEAVVDRELADKKPRP